MDLKEYREILLGDVKVNAQAELNYEKAEFLNAISNLLIESEELSDFTPCYFEGIGRKNRKILIDGYNYDELDETFCIFSALYNGTSDVETLNLTEIDRIFDRAKEFVEATESEMIQKNAEESSLGFELALYLKIKLLTIKKLKFYIFSDMILSERIKEIKSDTLFGIPIEYNVWDINRLYKLYESKSGREDIVINIEEFNTNGIPCLKASLDFNEEYDAYLCIIPGDILGTIYNTYGSRILEGNVRSFLNTKGKVNKGMRKTIISNPEMFFSYNNGIAATATDVKVVETPQGLFIKELTAFQIVNGGQTTASIAMAKINDKAPLNSIFVPMKLSVISQEKSDDVIPLIARYANSQNKVSEADFFSNHAFHIRIEEFSRRLLAPAVNGAQFGTRWFYERARGQYQQEQSKMTKSQKDKFQLQNPRRQMFTKTDLAKYINTSRKLPYIVSMGAQKNFLNFANWTTGKWETSDIEFNENFFIKSIALAVIFKSTENIVPKQKWYVNGYRANIVTYTISKLFEIIDQIYPEYSVNFKIIWQRQAISVAFEKQLEILTEIIYYAITSEPREIMNVTEWCKRESCWKVVRSIKADLTQEFIKELVYRNVVIEEEKNAKSDQKLENKLNDQITVVQLGSDFWSEIFAWGKNNKLLSIQEESIIKLATQISSGKIPSDKQSKLLINTLERLRLEGFPK